MPISVPERGSRKVLVYKTDILPFSETFIRDQVLSYQRWQATLAGLRYTRQLSLAGVDAQLLCNERGPDAWKIANDIRRVMWAFPREAARRVASHRPDIVHAHFGASGVEIWPLARMLHIPLLITLHGSDVSINADWFYRGKGGTLMRFYPGRLLRIAREPGVRFIAISEAVRRAAIRFGISPDKVTVRYIGLDPTKWQPGSRDILSRPRRILFVGRLIECKGCEHLVRSFLALKASVPDAELVIIGDGPLRQALEAQAKENENSVRFLGAVSPDEVKRQLGEARVLCLPSVTLPNGQAEGLGMVLLEAQASGVPVVAYGTGGVSEAIQDGETGFVVTEGDRSRLIERLRLVLENDSIAIRMSEAGPGFVHKHFDIRKCTRELELFYDGIVEGARQGGAAR
ncbi:MAG TPA: glycosyltransferase [Bradyrhizobium sp.]|nr:glycosyltransferase [Bradyrhizobium sp.]